MRKLLRVFEIGSRLSSGARSWSMRASLLCLLALLPVLLFVTERCSFEPKALRDVWVGDVAVSGLGRAESDHALLTASTRMTEQVLSLSLGGKLLQVTAAEIGAELDRRATVDAALRAGREGSLFGQIGEFFRRFWQSRNVAPKFKLRQAVFSRWVEAVERKGYVPLPVSGGVEWRGGQLRSRASRLGYRIDRAALEAELVRALSQRGGRVIEIKTRRVAPELKPGAVERALRRARELTSESVSLVSRDGKIRLEFTSTDLKRAIATRPLPSKELEVLFSESGFEAKLAKLKPELEAEPQDARFEVDASDRLSIVPSRPGTRVRAKDVAVALLRAAYAPARTGLLPVLRDAQPELTTEQAQALKITGLVAKFTTYYACCPPRVKNIHRIADLLDGWLVKPNETVSVNEKVGRRTVSNGFVAAPSIEDGEMVDTVGGGVSQFATTIFNALLHGGYDIIERQPHSYWFTRYPMGHEATLSWPKPDIIFRNDTAAGLLIKTHYTNKSITVKLFGDNGGRKVKTNVSERMDVVEPPVELLPDPEVSPDREEVREAGAVGWSVIAGRILEYPDGTQKEEKRKVTYKPRTRKVAVHPCRIPEGEKGYTGEPCPVPEDPTLDESLSSDGLAADGAAANEQAAEGIARP